MSAEITIRPADIRTGVPITVTVHGAGAGISSDAAVVTPKGVPGAERFQFPLLPARGGDREGQFTVALPGEYVVEANGTAASVSVAPQRNLAFGVEFGIFSFVVFLIVGGMVLWLRQRR